MASKKEQREKSGQVGSILASVSYTEGGIGDSLRSVVGAGGSGKSGAENAARSIANTAYDRQQNIFNSDTLLTDSNFDYKAIEDLIGLEANTQGKSHTGYTQDYNTLLGEYDPTTFLKAYKGYVASRLGSIEQNKSTPGLSKQTFLGGF